MGRGSAVGVRRAGEWVGGAALCVVVICVLAVVVN
jgi:hypothetical protein